MLTAVIRAAAEAGGGVQIGNNPATYIGGSGLAIFMTCVYRIVMKIIERGDSREDRQWAQSESDMTRKDKEIASLKKERDQYRDLWLGKMNREPPA